VKSLWLALVFPLLYNVGMSMEKNKERIMKIERMLDAVAPIKLGVNKKNELVRLLYEISTVENIDPSDVIA